MTLPGQLPERWRCRAEELEPYAPPAAVAWRTAADELAEALRDAEDEVLTLAEAAAESGYSKRRLRELLAEGTIPQAGRRGAPRIRRADLPHRVRRVRAHGYDLHEDAEALAGRI